MKTFGLGLLLLVASWGGGGGCNYIYGGMPHVFAYMGTETQHQVIYGVLTVPHNLGPSVIPAVPTHILPII